MTPHVPPPVAPGESRTTIPDRRSWDGVPARAGSNLSTLTALIRPALPRCKVIAAAAIPGGRANENLRLHLDGPPDSVRLRFFRRDPGQAGKEAALHRCLAGRVPVPRLLHLGHDNPLTGKPYALLDWVEGERLESAPPAADEIEPLGRAVGGVLAAIHEIGFPMPGLLDAGLCVVAPLPGGDLAGYLRHCFTERGATRIGGDLAAASLVLAADQGGRLDSWQGSHLVHGDFGGSNILLRRAAGAPAVAAVLDWEFAFSGSPAHDFGNLLRPPFGDLPGFAAALAAGYTASGGALPEDWQRLARLADLAAWAELASRPGAGDAQVADARAMIAGTLAAFRRDR